MTLGGHDSVYSIPPKHYKVKMDKNPQQMSISLSQLPSGRNSLWKRISKLYHPPLLLLPLSRLKTISISLVFQSTLGEFFCYAESNSTTLAPDTAWELQNRLDRLLLPTKHTPLSIGTAKNLFMRQDLSLGACHFLSLLWGPECATLLPPGLKFPLSSFLQWFSMLEAIWSLCKVLTKSWLPGPPQPLLLGLSALCNILVASLFWQA